MLDCDLTVATLCKHYAEVRKRLMGKLPVKEIAAAKSQPPESEPEPAPPPPRPQLAPPTVKTQYPLIDLILSEVMRFYHVRKIDLISDRRTKDIVLPRHVAIYLCRDLTPHSTPRIGWRFGGRDHTTILHACNKVSGRAAIDAEFAQEINTIRSRIIERHAEHNKAAA